MYKETLEKIGYKYYPPNRYDTFSHSYYKRMDTKIHCGCNEKPPSIYVEIYEINEHQSCSIGFRAEVNREWVNFQFYSLNLLEIENINYYEEKLKLAWEVINEAV